MGKMSYLTFVLDEEAGKGKKTNVWDVISTSGTPLGKIKWYSQWRTYCYYPWGDTLYNRGCLADIYTFIDEQMEARKV